jgi:hypothetical protein
MYVPVSILAFVMALLLALIVGKETSTKRTLYDS